MTERLDECIASFLFCRSIQPLSNFDRTPYDLRSLPTTRTRKAIVLAQPQPTQPTLIQPNVEFRRH